MKFRHLAILAAVLFAAACTKPETEAAPAAQPKPVAAAPAPAQPGLPMWVVKDADSTIYMTGTVHMLPADLKWTSPKLEAALKEASELWLELAMPADVEEFRRQAQPIIRRYAVSDGPTISSRLTETERQALARAFKAAGLSDKQAAAMDKMKPWYVSNAIATAPLASAGLSRDAGIDITLAGMARAQGHPVKGLEEIEDQAKVLAGDTEDDQMKTLRAYLAMPPAFMTASTWVAIQTFRAWANGNKAPVEAMVNMLETAGHQGAAGRNVDALLKNRNEHFAAEIEEMLKGSGVAFIAVGAGHLVGPNSVQNRLVLRGITAMPY